MQAKQFMTKGGGGAISGQITMAPLIKGLRMRIGIPNIQITDTFEYRTVSSPAIKSSIFKGSSGFLMALDYRIIVIYANPVL